jgi:CHAD domain-containing protein
MPKAPHPSPAAPLAHALSGRVAALRKHLRQALRGEVEAVHDARVATRRLKAALDLLRPLLPDGPRSQFAKALRQVRRSLGPVRDVDVMLTHVEAMRPARGEEAALAWVREQLRQRRATLRQDAAKRGARKLAERLRAWGDLAPEVRQSQREAAALVARAAPEQMAEFARRADAVAPPGGRGTDPAPAAEPAEDVHDLRLAGKAMRYTLELCAPLGFRLPASVAKRFKKLQDALGLWHDYAVLTDEVLRLALEAQLSVTAPRTYGGVLRLAARCWADAERHLGRFRTLWARAGAGLTTSVAAAFSSPGAAGGDGEPEPPPPAEAPPAASDASRARVVETPADLATPAARPDVDTADELLTRPG